MMVALEREPPGIMERLDRPDQEGLAIADIAMPGTIASEIPTKSAPPTSAGLTEVKYPITPGM